MNRGEIEKTLRDISKIKKETEMEILDSHVHPYDVLGVVGKDTIKKSFEDEDFLKPGIVERLEYNKIERLGLTLAFIFFPKYVHSVVREKYVGANKERLLREMDVSLVDRATLLPIEPWISSEAVGENFQHQRFIVLGSLDVNRIKLDEIEDKIKYLIKRYHIAGLKFHPNLQNFKPQPGDNHPEITKKLRKIYSVVEDNNLYLVFHGGYSDYSDINNPKYARSKTNSLLKMFSDYNGKSELFNNYDIPIIIAHLGHNAILQPDYRLIKAITKKFPNVYFDNSGASVEIIKKVLRITGHKKIVFGSDALYNNMVYNLVFLYKALKDVSKKEDFKENLIDVLGNTYKTKILRR